MRRFLTTCAVSALMMTGAYAQTPKVDDLRNRVRSDMVVIDSCIATKVCTPEATKFLSLVEFSTERYALGFMNRRVNMTIAYKNEPIDVWQSPLETLKLGTGDCEDFAILKLAALYYAGFDKKDLVLQITRDHTGDHAVAGVKWLGNWVYLDNNTLFINPIQENVKYRSYSIF